MPRNTTLTFSNSRLIHDSIVELAHETVAAFDWLAEPIAVQSSITFVPNPGNVGDAAINLACWRYLSARFSDIEICSASAEPSRCDVFIGGGGNLVEGFYEDISSFLKRLDRNHHVYLFPSTVVGNVALLSRIAPTARVICREPVSFEHVAKVIPRSQIALGHDAAFALGPPLRKRFSSRIEATPARVGMFYRADRERARPEAGGVDVLGNMVGMWTDMALAERALDAAIGMLLGCGTVHTDRLHGAVMAGILGRQTVFYPNAYFKNEAVFHHSLVRLANVRFET